jgi:hypothetical protein
MKYSPVILSVTALQGMRSVIQVVENHAKDTSAEHVDRTLTTSMTVRLRTRDPPVETGSGTVEADVVPRRRSDVSARMIWPR